MTKIDPKISGTRPQDVASKEELLLAVTDVLRAEANAITAYSQHADSCVEAIRLIDAASGPLIIAGIGKSGHIARKIASTFSSLGKPAIYLHAAEASHGDLGLVQRGTVVLILSNSGETSELSDLLYYCHSYQIPMISITGRANSTLAKASDVAIVYGDVKEVCRNGLAPTTSTTLSLAIGDALAVGLSYLLGTEPEDFRRYHPGGKLGSRLVCVGDLMKSGEALPVVAPNTPMAEVVVIMSEKALGVAVVVEDGHVHGIVTDGDMRRNIEALWASSAGEIATTDPVRIRKEWRVSDAMTLMGRKGITAAIVENENGSLEGLLHIHDCIRAGAAA